MPYHIGKEGTSGCAGFPVIKDSDGSVMGCHKTKEDAKKQLAALYINEPEASKEEKSTVKDLTTAFFEIVKSDRREDGTMMVYGKATDDSLDIDQQICDPAWLDRAMPDWFKTGGNIREQHSNIAAGVAKEYEKKSDGHYIHALVVDPISVKKVETGVLKGFSIGIKAPRIVRDEKAANGRIIDGQIVEVSIVDRPANPNCQLVLAKSVAGESGIWKVEELIESQENSTEKAVEFERNLTESGKVKTASEIISSAKTLTAGDIKKFDQKLYDDARTALAQLIVVEAKEMDTEGSNEEMSLSYLLAAVHNLFAWYAGEEAEGETMENESIEMAAKKDADGMDMCAKCNKSEDMCMCEGGYKAATCAKCNKSKSACKCAKFVTADETADKPVKEKPSSAAKSVTHKCLECGCGTPQDSHGATTVSDLTNFSTPANVSTATMINAGDTPKSAEGEEVKELEDQELPAVKEAAPAEEAAEEAAEVSTTENVEEEVKAIVEEAVKSATKSLTNEIANLISANKAASEKAVGLETELATAKSLAAAGGPKRTIRPVDHASNDLLVKAATYKAKADASTDPDLVKGYKALYQEFLAKHAAATESN